MALITTVGGSTSESYATIAEADLYFIDRNSATWAALSTDSKEAALRYAAVHIDGYSFTGAVDNSTQALAWPRYGATSNGWAIDSTTIPQKIKDAQIEAALRQATEPLDADLSSGTVTQKTVGSISVSYSENTNDGRKNYQLIDKILKPLLSGGGRSYHSANRV